MMIMPTFNSYRRAKASPKGGYGMVKGKRAVWCENDSIMCNVDDGENNGCLVCRNELVSRMVLWPCGCVTL